MKDSFVFYKSFREVLEVLEDDADWVELLRGVFAYAFDGEVSFFTDPKLRIAFTHFKISIDSASARYEKAVESGKLGGRPSKKVFIPPDVWIGSILEHGSIPKAAKALGLSKQTLYNWVLASEDPRLEKVQKSKNLAVSVSVSESDAVSDSDKRNFKKTPSQPPAGAIAPPSAPDVKKVERWIPPPLPTD